MHSFYLIIYFPLFSHATANPLSTPLPPSVTSTLPTSDPNVMGNQLPASTLDTILTNETATGPIRCYRGMIFSRWPYLENCLSAVDHLPHWAETGNFHEGGSYIGDPFRLDGRPVASQNCEIFVSIPLRGQEVRSSWIRIRALAVDIAAQCRIDETRDPARTRGGYVMEGEPEGIRIEVRKRVIRPVE